MSHHDAVAVAGGDRRGVAVGPTGPACGSVPSPPDREEWRRKREVLERRLDDGYVKIGQAQAEGRDVTAWEALWMELLTEYATITVKLGEEIEHGRWKR